MSKTKYYIGIDFGSKITRAAVLVETSESVKLFDLIELPLSETFSNNSDRYKAGILDVSNYLKAKKIILKSAVTNLDNRYIRAVPHIVEVNNRMLFKSISGSLIKHAKNKAMSPRINPDEKIVDQYLGSLSVDGKKTTEDINISGRKVRQDSVSIVTKTTDYIELMNAANETGVFIEDVVPSNLTTHYFIDKINLTPKEFSLFIDFGARITKVCFYNQQRILAVENFEVGGDDITNLIAEELGCSFEEAEKFKLSNEFRALMEGKKEKPENVRIAHRLRNEKLVLLQLISHYAIKYGLDLQNLRNIVIAGGGAKMPALQESIIEFFQKPCEKIGEKSFKYFLNYKVSPEISCSIGLAYSSYTKRQDQVNKRTIRSKIGRYFQLKIENILFTD